MEKEIDIYIECVLTRLKKIQNKNGSWGENNFITAFVAHATVKMGWPNKKSITYIQSQKNEHWLWNYYPCPLSSCPDDADDTFAALSALYVSDKKHLNEKAFVYIAHTLMSIQEKEGGPYQTWIGVTKKEKDAGGKWRDIDLIVNSNIAYFLSLMNIRLKPLLTHLDKGIMGDIISHTKYYKNSFVAYYFLSRGYSGSKKAFLIRKIKKEYYSEKINSFEKALSITSLLYLGEPSSQFKKEIKNIISLRENPWQIQQKIYIEKIVSGIPVYPHSEAFVTALYGEMVALFKKAKKRESTEKNAMEMGRVEMRFKKDIHTMITKRTAGQDFSPMVQKEMMRMIQEIFSDETSNAKSHTYMFPFLMWKYLRKNHNKENKEIRDQKIPDTVYRSAQMSVYGWMAYTIYNNKIDHKNSSQDRTLIPIANIFHREMVTLCEEVFDKKNKKYYYSILDIFDSAQYMEIKQLRLKRKDVNTILVPYILPKINRKKYIQKSIGYTTPCVAILHHVLRSDFKENIKKVTSFLSIQVDLKQSSDDIRDWEEDLRAGILTPVTQGILSVWQKFPHNGEVLNLEKDRQILKSIFENKVLISESKRIINNTRKAEGILRILQKENLFTDDSFLRNYLVTIKSVAQKILNDHALTQPITEDIYPDYTPRPRHIPPHPG